jgi:hypothetical protein
MAGHGSRGAAALGPEKVERNKQIRRDERSAAERHCQPLACQLQACASRWVYKPQKCDELKQVYRRCIDDFLEAAATSTKNSAAGGSK